MEELNTNFNTYQVSIDKQINKSQANVKPRKLVWNYGPNLLLSHTQRKKQNKTKEKKSKNTEKAKNFFDFQDVYFPFKNEQFN